MKFKLETGIPIPPKVSGGGNGRAPLYPYLEMGDGDSFFAAGKNAKSFRSGAIGFATRHPELKVHLVVRDVVEKGVKGVRVWAEPKKTIHYGKEGVVYKKKVDPAFLASKKKKPLPDHGDVYEE